MIDEIFIQRLPKGAKRAILAMSSDWQFCGKNTFDANGAHSAYMRGLAEYQNMKDGKWSRWAYRLTEKGKLAAAVLAKATAS